jgi:hypothetical protein
MRRETGDRCIRIPAFDQDAFVEAKIGNVIPALRRIISEPVGLAAPVAEDELIS